MVSDQQLDRILDNQPTMEQCLKSKDACKKYFEGNMVFARHGMVTRNKIEGKTFTGMFRTHNQHEADRLSAAFKDAGFYTRVIKGSPGQFNLPYSVVARRK